VEYLVFRHVCFYKANSMLIIVVLVVWEECRVV